MKTAIATTAAVAVLTLAMVQSTAGQERSAPDPDYRAPRTADGLPDISGIWTNDTLTPMERPARLGDQAFYTEEEAAEIERSGREMLERDSAPGSTRTTPRPGAWIAATTTSGATRASRSSTPGARR